MNDKLCDVLKRQWELLKGRVRDGGWNEVDAVDALCDRIEAMYGFRPNHNERTWRLAYHYRIVDDVMVNQ